MLDLAGILFSSVMMLIVLVRAVQLDRTLPWFEKVKREKVLASPDQRPWQRHS